MLRQKQAKLLENLFLLICKSKGVKVAEEFLQSLLTEDVTTRSQLNSYLSSFLQSDAYVIKYLSVKTEGEWLLNFEENVLGHLIEKYEEVSSWALRLTPQ